MTCHRPATPSRGKSRSQEYQPNELKCLADNLNSNSRLFLQAGRIFKKGAYLYVDAIFEGLLVFFLFNMMLVVLLGVKKTLAMFYYPITWRAQWRHFLRQLMARQIRLEFKKKSLYKHDVILAQNIVKRSDLGNFDEAMDWGNDFFLTYAGFINILYCSSK